MTPPIPEKILLLLEYLKKYQRPDGSFEGNAAFYSYLIPLTCATVSHLYDTDPIILPALSFIESQFDPDLSINYWKQGSPRATSSPLPNDLDDTFTALSALAVHGKIFTPSELSRSITLLVSNEVSIGGPYYTWHVSSGERMNWENLDPVVNSIILFFLYQQGIPLPELEAWINNAIESSLSSVYYVHPIPLIYRVALSCPNQLRANLLQQLLKQTPTNTLENALYVSTCIRLNRNSQDLQPLITDLLQTPISDIKPYPFFVERVRDGVPEYSGCAAFTAAAIVEALALFEQATEKATAQANAVSDQTPTTYSEVFAQVETFCETHDPSIRTSLEHQVSLFSGIPMLPMLWWEHLSPSLQDIVPRESAVTLSVAHLLGTAGCTLLDDIIDQDASVDYIPTGTILSRKAFSLFLECATNAPLVIQTFDAMDNAQHWEQTNAHIPTKDGTITLPETFPDYADYSILAQKSQGLALGAVLLMQQTNPLLVKHVRQWFHHYLIARQLNDDAHDWLQDLEKGFLNPVGTMVLQKYAASHSNTTISLSQERQVLQETFWHDVLDDVAERVREHLAGARLSMESCTFLTSTDFLEKLLSPLERSVQTALKERDDAQKFLEAYSMHE